jgi:diguanylate cyclase (GGDEF)-like protein
MQMDKEIANRTINLLSSVELAEVSALVAEIVQSLTKSPSVAVILWDPDLESLSDRFVYGSPNQNINQFMGAYCDEFRPDGGEIDEIAEDAFTVSIPEQFRPLYCYQIKRSGTLCACVLFALKEPIERQTLLEQFNCYPLVTALSHAWELRELQKENTRLRDSYDQLEDKTSMLEEQTRKLIHDLTARDTIRTRHVERERLVYSISNVVRSYVDIQKVLETTVERIGATFGVSHCLLLRPIDTTDQLSVYEYTRSSSSVKDLFLTPEGTAFTETALKKVTPHDLGDPDLDDQQIYDRSFLRSLGIRSGLIVPLVMRDRVLGVLFLQDCAEPRAWSIDDISLIGSLADQVSVAIENAELHQEKERQAITDGLTGIANRRSFNATIAREFERAKRYEQSLSLVLIDLDFLKVINDTFGHQVGDEAIKEIGRMLRQYSRTIDLAARYGGEEFCLLLPNTDIVMAEQLAERLRKLIEDVHIEGPGHISASLGVASYPIHALDPDTLFRKADEALYEAKQAGRNLVKVASSQQEGSQRLTDENGSKQPGKIQDRQIVDVDAKESSGTNVSK